MARTIATLFHEMRDAQAAFNDLIARGAATEKVSLAAVVREQRAATEFQPGATGGKSDTGIATPHRVDAKGIGEIFVTGRLAAALDKTGARLLAALVEMDLDEDDARPLAEGVRRGNVLLMAIADDDTQADRFEQTIHAHHPIERERRVQAWQAGGWRTFEESASQATGNELAQERGLAEHRLTYRPGETYPRDGAGGGVWSGRAPHTDDEREIAEHARAERLEAEGVENFGSEKGPAHAVADNPPAYRQHFDASYPNQSFEEYLPAYRYGALLASSSTFQDHDWNVLESHARQNWERIRPHTWDRYCAAVHFGWENARAQGHAAPERRTQARTERPH